MNHHEAYGLTIASELSLDALLPIPPTDPDVVLRFGKVPRRIYGARLRARAVQAKRGAYLLKKKGNCRIRVEDGRRITVQRTGGTDQAMQDALLVSALPALLLQRQVLLLHASAVRVGQGAVVVAGRTGNGKTTVLASLLELGHEMLADDIVAIGYDPRGTPMVQPAFPIMVLRGEGWDEFASGHEPLDEDSGAVRVRRFYRHPTPISVIYFLAPGRTGAPSLIPLEGLAQFEAIAAHTYGLEYLSGLNIRAAHFEGVRRLTGAVRAARVDSRPEDYAEVRALAGVIAAAQ